MPGRRRDKNSPTGRGGGQGSSGYHLSRIFGRLAPSSQPDPFHEVPGARTVNTTLCANAPRRTEREMRQLNEAGKLTGRFMATARSMTEYRAACREVGRPFRINRRNAVLSGIALAKHGILK